MNVYAKDLIFGDFRASDYQLTAYASFDGSGDSEEETNIGMEITREFIADNPVPVYIGQQYSQVLQPVITLSKDVCQTDDIYLSEYDCRAVLRLVTGQNHYEWLKIITEDEGEDIWYRAKVISVSYEKLNGKVTGIVLSMECDSQFAWSVEHNITINAEANKPFNIFINTDDLWNYILPFVTIIPSVSGNLEITNQTDKNWRVALADARRNEILTYDCKKEIIDSSRNASGIAVTNLLNYSNCHFFRLLPDKNVYVSNMDAKITFTFREPRKTAFSIY